MKSLGTECVCQAEEGEVQQIPLEDAISSAVRRIPGALSINNDIVASEYGERNARHGLKNALDLENLVHVRAGYETFTSVEFTSSPARPQIEIQIHHFPLYLTGALVLVRFSKTTSSLLLDSIAILILRLRVNSAV
jgi:hypothetical protein